MPTQNLLRSLLLLMLVMRIVLATCTDVTKDDILVPFPVDPSSVKCCWSCCSKLSFFAAVVMMKDIVLPGSRKA